MNKKNITKKKKKIFNINFFNLYCNFTENNIILGHNSLKLQKSWHDNLTKCFFGARNKTIIFNYKFILKYLIKAAYIFTAITKSNGDVLIVNTNPELSKLMYHIKKNVKSSHLFFSDCGYTKGSLTNWTQVYTKVKTFIMFYYDFDSFLTENNIYFPNYKKMKKNYKGFINNNIISEVDNSQYNKNFINDKKHLVFNNFNNIQNYSKKYDISSNALHANWKPDLIILISTDNTESIIKEAYNLNIPTIGFLDSNSKISNITYPVPINTYYYSFIWFVCTLITKLSNKYSNL